MTHNITKEAKHRYAAISKKAGEIWAAANYAASQAYDRELEPHKALLARRLAIFPPGTNTPESHHAIYEAYTAYSAAMLKADGRYESTMNKANARMAVTMKAAWEELLQGKPVQLAQLDLFEEEMNV